uniref:C2H2-type domain-containing protein n=1 Tax=Ciona savignyi TaxID=51511 RepID=H2Z1R9_CIOSA
MCSLGSVKHLKVQILTNGDSEPSKSKMKISRPTVANVSENSKQLRIKNGNFKKPFSCKICNKNFKSVSGLAMHVNQHTQNIDFTCPICSKSYNYSSSLKYHLKNQVCIRKHNKNISGLEYLETLVDKNQIRKKFSNKITNNKLNSRIKRPFQCGDCGHTFDDPKI